MTLTIYDLIYLTIALTIEQENRYIIDRQDINNTWNIIETNLRKQKVELYINDTRYAKNDYSNFELFEGKYYVALPWYDLKQFLDEYMGRFSSTLIKACYENDTYKNTSKRSEEDLEKLNQAYERFLDLKEKEAQEERDNLKEKVKTLTHKINKINQRKTPS